MPAQLSRIDSRDSLHERVTRALALRIINAERAGEHLAFPNEAEMCEQLGVSRSILRESVKVLEDKGMLVSPAPLRGQRRARPRAEWNLLDPDILAWQARLAPDARFLRDLCEVRLAIEPTAAGFAALPRERGRKSPGSPLASRDRGRAGTPGPGHRSRNSTSRLRSSPRPTIRCSGN